MKIIYVDSRDRVSGSTTDFAIQLPETLTIDGGSHRGRIDNLRVPLVIPTIRTGVNDTLQVRPAATTYTVTIPQGNYDGPGLASTLVGLLNNTAPGAWNVTYDSSNISMSISCGNNFTIVGGTYAAQLMSRPYTQTANSYNFSYVSMQGIDMLYLTSSDFSNLDIVGPGGQHDTLMAAVPTTPFGSVMDASMPYDIYFDVPAMTKQQLTFQLRDRSYNVLTIVPNISFQLTIE
jgi:hypothetical protein